MQTLGGKQLHKFRFTHSVTGNKTLLHHLLSQKRVRNVEISKSPNRLQDLQNVESWVSEFGNVETSVSQNILILACKNFENSGWNCGVSKFRSVGITEFQNFGKFKRSDEIFETQGIRILKHREVEKLQYRNSGMSTFREVGILFEISESRNNQNTVISKFRKVRITEFWNSEIDFGLRVFENTPAVQSKDGCLI